MAPRLALMLGALVLIPAAVHPQNAPARPGEDRWQIGLEDGQYIWDIRLVRLTGDSLVFRQADTLGAVSVQKIGEVRLIQKTTVTLGAGAPPGGAIGALTGADDEVYDLLTLDYPARLKTIQQILLMHPPAQ